MASRDKSQGFGFVYVDIEKLLAQRDQLKKQPAVHPQADSAVTVNLNRETKVPSLATVTNIDPGQTVNARLVQIRENLDRLQTLHHKLHAVLEELTKATDEKKRR